MSNSPPAAAPTLAATVLLVRDQPQFEVLMVKRHHQIDFASGALVFPGGKAEPGDQDPRWAKAAKGFLEAGPELGPLKVAAVREAFEESGVLLARTPGGAPFSAGPEAASAREKVARGDLSFLDLVIAQEAVLDLSAMGVYARWITPNVMPRRFDTWFFLARAPEDQLAVCDGYETVDAEWIAPAEALRLGEAGERKIVFPTRMNLRLLAESRSAEAALAAARARTLVAVEPRVELRDGERVLVLPPDAGYGVVVELLSAAT